MKTANLIGSVSRCAGGLFDSVRHLVLSLAQLNVGVRVFSTEDAFTAEDIEAWRPLEVSVFRARGPRAFGFCPALMPALMDYQPDLTHTHGIWMFPSVATTHYSRRARTPYMLSPHGMLDPWAVRHHRWRKAIAYALFEGAHLRNACCIRALCQSEAQSIRRLGLRNPVCIIPNGIHLPEATEAGHHTPPPPWHQVVEPGRKVLLYLGRLHPKKGLTNLLKAWKEMGRKPSASAPMSEWTLAIAGWDQGGHESQLKQLASDLDLSWLDLQPTDAGVNRPASNAPSCAVCFLGPRFGPQKTACYRGCDAFILPSFSEGLPMVVLEAWAHARPVLMTPQCNFPEGFSHNAALRIEPTVEGISAGLEALMTASASSLLGVADAGRKLVTDHFAWPGIARNLKLTYDWMLGGGSPPDCLHDG